MRVDGEKRIVAPGGVSYRVLALPGHKVLSLAAAKKVAELVAAGAAVVGERPERCVSLVGGAAAQKEFREIAERLWGGLRPAVVSGVSAREWLQKAGVGQDFTVVSGADAREIDYIHCTLDGADVYFVSNQTPAPRFAVCAFRATGRRPELWDPLTGEIRPLDVFSREDGTTRIPLEFDPCGAYFVVFAEKDCGREKTGAERNFPEYAPLAAIDGEWRVSFDPAWGGPGETVFPSLADWTRSKDDGIRFYSGAATYRKDFDFSGGAEGRVFIELGEVLDVGVATVTLNGKRLGTVWTKPFRIDASGVLKSGKNSLEVRVVNSWHNRVFGDQTRGGKKKFTQTNIRLGKRRGSNAGLSPSGLLGPVRIVKAKSIRQ